MSLPVALDAYGADGGPEVVLDGARLAAADGIPVRLFGPGELEAPAGVELDATTEWIGNEAEPVAAVRSTPDASSWARLTLKGMQCWKMNQWPYLGRMRSRAES